MKEEISIAEKLRLLYRLQTVDTQIDELRILAGELPQEVKNISDEIEGLKTRLNNITEQQSEIVTTINDYKIKIDNDRASISRYKEQQDSVRNNREYENLSKEIEYSSLDIQLCEKYIHEAEEKQVQLSEEKSTTETAISEREEALKNKKSELETIMSETQEQVERLTAQSEKMESDIKDERLLAAFKRIRKKAHNGLAIAPIDREACGGCHSKIPAQSQIDVRKHDKIMFCEFCGRILIDDTIVEEAKKA